MGSELGLITQQIGLDKSHVIGLAGQQLDVKRWRRYAAYVMDGAWTLDVLGQNARAARRQQRRGCACARCCSLECTV